jgi:hypothetical protein
MLLRMFSIGAKLVNVQRVVIKLDNQVQLLHKMHYSLYSGDQVR